MVYHIDALRRAKKLPRLDKLLAKKKKRKGQPQSWQEQQVIMSNWAARVDRALTVRKELDGR